MQRKIIVPNEFLSLAEEELRQGKNVKILADGASMFPFIRGGKDTVEIRPLQDNETPEKWRVYMFLQNGHYIIHRLVDEDKDQLIMKGDGNLKIEERIKHDEIIGVLSKIYRSDGKMTDCTESRWLQKGKIWHRLSPVRRYLLAAARRLQRYGLMR